MQRSLAAIRFELTPPVGKSGRWFLTVGLGPVEKVCAKPPAGKKWCQVVAGDVLLDVTDGEPRSVLDVAIYRAQGAEEGDRIVSGADWLRTGRTLTAAGHKEGDRG